MTVTFHALWMLCALGTIVIAAAAAGQVRELAAMVAGLIAAAVLTGADRLPDPVWAGVLAVGAAAIYLCSPRYGIMGAAAGGALAGMWTALLEAQGLPSVVAILVAAGAVAATVWLARSRPVFAPEILRDEGLLATGVLGLSVWVLPGILDGWQSATNLNVETQQDQAVGAIPTWTMLLVGTSVACGALHSLWNRR